MADQEDHERTSDEPAVQRRLPRVSGGRGQVVKVRLTEQEEMVLAARAGAAGVSRQRFLVDAALAAPHPAPERRALYAVLTSARRSVMKGMVNLNQLARVANSTGQVPRDLGGLAAALERAVAVMEAGLAELAGGA